MESWIHIERRRLEFFLFSSSIYFLNMALGRLLLRRVAFSA